MSETTPEKPPVFNRWKSWYWLVIAVMAVQVAIYLVITMSFA